MDKVRALLVVGAGGTGVVVATDSASLACDIEEITDRCSDLDLGTPSGCGFWLWEGERRTHAGGPNYEDTASYHGATRAVGPDEFFELSKMVPSFVACPECSKAGGADRPVYHLPPVCQPETQA